jgi:hypothetical protein
MINVNQRARENNQLVITWHFSTKESAENFIYDVINGWNFDNDVFYLELEAV